MTLLIAKSQLMVKVSNSMISVTVICLWQLASCMDSYNCTYNVTNVPTGWAKKS